MAGKKNKKGASRKEKKKLKALKKEKPSFNVLNYGFMKRVKARWRKPRGTHNKKRLKKAWAGALPNIGYKNTEEVRGTHPCGLKEVRVFNASDLEGLSDVAVRIASGVGKKKRAEIIAKAKERGLVVLNGGVSDGSGNS